MYEMLMACLALIPGGEAAGRAALAAVATKHVRQLAHAGYRVREASARELRRLGPAALAPLRAGTADPDVERASRCKEVLAQVEAADRETKLARLLADPAAPPPDGLPLLTEFLKVTGDGRAARVLYSHIYRENGPTLMMTAADPASTAALEHVCEALCRLRHSAAEGLGATELAWVSFLVSRASPEGVRGVVQDGLQWAWWSGGAIKLLRQAGPESPLRRLFLASLERHRNHMLFGWMGTRMVQEARMRDAVPALLRIVSDPGTMAGSRAHALALLAVLGDRRTARELRANPNLFTDSSELGGTQLPSDYGVPVLFIQVRDVALGVCAEMEGRDLDDLGFVPGPRKFHGSEASPYKYAFLDDASRAAAFEKWKKLPPPDPK